MSTATTLSLLEPTVAAGLAMLVLHERLQTPGWIGAALICACLVILSGNSPSCS